MLLIEHVAVCYVYDTFLGCDGATTEAQNIQNSSTMNKKKMILHVWPAQMAPCKPVRNE